MSRAPTTGRTAVEAKGWWRAHKWLVLRRASQVFFLGLFLVGPVTGFWIVKGTIASSRTLDVLSLTDPYVLLQSLAAGQLPALTAVTGALIVAAVYALIGGRMYCSWACPLNIVTDAAHWCRERLGLAKGWQPRRGTRLWMLAMTFAAAAFTGTIAWELVNPVTLLYRGLIYGIGFAWVVVIAVFLFDLAISRRGWCGHLCPVGAFYGLLGAGSLLRVSARRRERCDDCMDCFAVCPEPHVITPALKPATAAAGPVVLARDCTNCGRCIDACSKDVFTFASRFDARRADAVPAFEPHDEAA